MRTLKTVLRALYLAIVLLIGALIVIPHFLDRIDYRGPVSSHFDGRRFFNPDGSDSSASSPKSNILSPRLLRFLLTDDRPKWPDHVPVTPTKPAARVEGEQMRVTWIGHSTALIQTQGMNILTDPIWSNYAGPMAGIGPRRHRAPGVMFDDLPKIDLVLLSHSHYDHMDIPTLRKLWRRDRPLIVTSLGNDTILKGKGIEAVARDWGQSVTLRSGVQIYIDRVHHWGSRFGKDRNRMLWSGFTIALPGGNIFFAGDTGLGDGHWPYEAAAHGPVRFALIPIGAYLPRSIMAPNHIDPEEAVTVFERLGAMYALGIHWGTFQLSAENMDDPPARLRGALAVAHVGEDRFRTTEAGEAWDIPSISPAAQR